MLIASIILFLLLSAMFSASEIAFISANKLAIEIQKKKGSRKSRILTNFYDNHRNFLGTMLVGNNIALVIFTSLMTTLLEPYISPYTGVGVWFLLSSTLIITLVVLLFGEFLPKTIARIFANTFINLMTYPLAFFKYILGIPTWFMTITSGFVLKYIMRAPVSQVNNPITRLDLENFIESSVNSVDDEIETELFKNALNLKEVRVRDCMIPRNEIIFIEKSDSIENLTDQFIESEHSRLIVVNNDIENVEGYVHHLQLMKNPKSIKSIMMDIAYVPEAMNVQDLLGKFVRGNINMACVVNEFGGTAGIITLEDILEEIFGEIEDEHDKEDLLEFEISKNEYIFSGRAELDYINEKYEHIEIPSGEYHTLSGYLVMTAGNIPEQGEEVELNGYLFTIEKVSDTKIETIRLMIPDEPSNKSE